MSLHIDLIILLYSGPTNLDTSSACEMNLTKRKSKNMKIPDDN